MRAIVHVSFIENGAVFFSTRRRLGKKTTKPDGTVLQSAKNVRNGPACLVNKGKSGSFPVVCNKLREVGSIYVPPKLPGQDDDTHWRFVVGHVAEEMQKFCDKELDIGCGTK